MAPGVGSSPINENLPKEGQFWFACFNCRIKPKCCDWEEDADSLGNILAKAYGGAAEIGSEKGKAS